MIRVVRLVRLFSFVSVDSGSLRLLGLKVAGKAGTN